MKIEFALPEMFFGLVVVHQAEKRVRNHPRTAYISVRPLKKGFRLQNRARAYATIWSHMLKKISALGQGPVEIRFN